MQSSIPNYPDPSRAPSFVALGHQQDNNVLYAQHALAISLNATEMETLSQVLQSSRLCSHNFYREIATDLASKLVSPALHVPTEPIRTSALYKALMTSDMPRHPVTRHAKLYTAFQQLPIQVIGKSKYSHVPPWALVATILQADLSVASW